MKIAFSSRGRKKYMSGSKTFFLRIANFLGSSPVESMKKCVITIKKNLPLIFNFSYGLWVFLKK